VHIGGNWPAACGGLRIANRLLNPGRRQLTVAMIDR